MSNPDTAPPSLSTLGSL